MHFAVISPNDTVQSAICHLSSSLCVLAPVRNLAVRRYLSRLLVGKWQKVIKSGTTGEVHYFEHASGQVAGVKFFPSQGA